MGPELSLFETRRPNIQCLQIFWIDHCARGILV